MSIHRRWGIILQMDTAILIRWEKDGAYGVTKYYDMDGQEIKLNPGKTWVCILPNDRMDKAEFYGEQTE